MKTAYAHACFDSWNFWFPLSQNPKPVLSFAEASKIQNSQTIWIPSTPMT